MKRGVKWKGGAVIVLLAAAAVLVCFFLGRFHWRVEFSTRQFTESARSLKNPNRGFYYIYRFMIGDETNDYGALVKEQFADDTETSLALIQINLQEYRNGAISEQGLANIRGLFEALSGSGKQLLVRFLYDWNGENALYEPESIDIILGHMAQVEDILRDYSAQIFAVQGLFIGNWGEMNGSEYTDTESLRLLANRLLEVTEETTWLSVRTPAQWRQTTGLSGSFSEELSSHPLAGRLGLYNDGMLGSESDYGTYASGSGVLSGGDGPWSREEELAFQEELCSITPNGGEVIVDNPYNDLENAIRDFRSMHVTYLNQDYDKAVLDKWEAQTVTTGDCFDGMDGLSYISRHLGYRLVLTETGFSHDFWQDRVTLQVCLKNVGFAPIYRDCRAVFVLCGADGEQERTYEAPQSLTGLSGGNNDEKEQELSAEVLLGDLKGERYSVYFYLEDTASGAHIQLGNGQDEEEKGYFLGSFTL